MFSKCVSLLFAAVDKFFGNIILLACTAKLFTSLEEALQLDIVVKL